MIGGTDSWIELELETTPEVAESIADALHDLVDGGVVMEQLNDAARSLDRWEDQAATGPVIVRGYLPNADGIEDAKARVEFALRCLNLALRESGQSAVPMPNYRLVQRADWAEAWKQHFQPLRIAQHVLICPSWIDPASLPMQTGDVLLMLDPGQAFGTGLHPTTQLCAAALEVWVPEAEKRLGHAPRVLDVGSGTAILAIIAAKLGAAECLGVDIEAEAVAAGRENARNNGVADRVRSEPGSWDAGAVEGSYDLVVANILAPVIIRLLGDGMGGVGHAFIFSGILDTQADAVIAAMAVAGLRLTNRTQMADWVCLWAVRDASRSA